MDEALTKSVMVSSRPRFSPFSARLMRGAGRLHEFIGNDVLEDDVAVAVEVAFLFQGSSREWAWLKCPLRALIACLSVNARPTGRVVHRALIDSEGT